MGTLNDTACEAAQRARSSVFLIEQAAVGKCNGHPNEALASVTMTLGERERDPGGQVGGEGLKLGVGIETMTTTRGA